MEYGDESNTQKRVWLGLAHHMLQYAHTLTHKHTQVKLSAQLSCLKL